MTTRFDDPLATAMLSERERRVLRRLLDLLRSELGSDLLAVWLYGSRARGEADPDETHHDRRSDIDLIAILSASRDVNAFKWEFTPKLIELVEAEGDSPPYYSLHMYDADRLRDRRRIRSFFFQEVDRDKIVLAGGRLDSAEFR